MLKEQGGDEEGWGGPFPNFFSGQLVSTPWNACTAAGQPRGCCSRTHCHTCRGRQGDKKNSASLFQIS